MKSKRKRYKSLYSQYCYELKAYDKKDDAPFKAPIYQLPDQKETKSPSLELTPKGDEQEEVKEVTIPELR